MAEFLIYAKRHYMDDWTLEKVAAMDPEDKKRRYDSRLQPGDILEVRPDGFWSNELPGNGGYPCFALVTVPGLSVSTAMQFLDPICDVDGKLLHKRKYRIKNVNFLTQKRLNLTLANINSYIEIKTVT
jgi:hypothetical protein